MKRVHSLAAFAILYAGGLFLALPGSVASAQTSDTVPEELEGVGVIEHLGDAIPLDLTFCNEAGTEVALREYFTGGRPVMLTMNYYSCPMLCTLQLNGLIDALQDLAWTPGKEFELVTVSINPRETPQLATLKKQNYMKEYGRPEAAPGWHFLTGREENIKRLAEAVGFEYKYDEATNQYSHVAALMILTPDAHLARYLYGVMYEPKTLRLSLLEAAEGKIGSAADQILLFCFHFDTAQGRYTLAAVNLVRAAAVLTVVVLGVALGALWLRRNQDQQASLEEPHP